jgi:hypothetical protein
MSDEKVTGLSLLSDIEAHCGKKVESRRLRLHIASTFDRLIDDQEQLRASVSNVLKGHSTYDVRTQKAISRPNQ